ncbi:MAG: hypothetical protein AAF646_15940 [Pseudomonadota bacterium]
MPTVWEWLCESDSTWSIKTFHSRGAEDYKRTAGVIAFDGRVTLTVDEQLMRNARKGCKLSNFTLAHELGHLALDHHASSAVTKNFRLFSGPSGESNIPPTAEELEANYAAVFFQCGVALFDDQFDALALANRAFCDVPWVKKAQRAVRTTPFRLNYERLIRPKRRVVL